MLEKSPCYDFVIIGSGFGGSVAAMRLSEKGYSVLILERGKRFEDKDFPKTNWNLWKSLWLPPLRCFGTWHMSFMNGLIALHGSGVGGGSLMYANVLVEPDERLFAFKSWHQLADWKKILRPHYDTAKRMLGVTTNPRMYRSDEVLCEIAGERGKKDTFQPTQVGVFFGEEEVTVPDPYFGGKGPDRTGCNFCGGCMVGCRYNAKNSLPKNYLYFAEKQGVQILPETKAVDIRPLSGEETDGARYEVVYHRSTALLYKPRKSIRARNVIVAAGMLGTLELLFSCRDLTHSLPRLSGRLGNQVYSNSENLQGVITRQRDLDLSKGIAISSITQVNEDTYVEVVRFSDGSSFIRTISAPLVDGRNFLERFFKSLWAIVRHPIDFLYEKLLPGWARHTTILLMMQPLEEYLRIRLGCNPFTLFRKGLVFRYEQDQQRPAGPPVSASISRQFAGKINGIASSTFMESLFNYPITAHLMGGVPLGQNEKEGVVGLDMQVHNYPGLYVVDGSVMPGNPGVNPSLTITALAEYAMAKIPKKKI